MGVIVSSADTLLRYLLPIDELLFLKSLYQANLVSVVPTLDFALLKDLCLRYLEIKVYRHLFFMLHVVEKELQLRVEHLLPCILILKLLQSDEGSRWELLVPELKLLFVGGF